jgi:hypothetical protein
MKNQWTYKFHTIPLADTGDYSTHLELTNGKQTFRVYDVDTKFDEDEGIPIEWEGVGLIDIVCNVFDKLETLEDVTINDLLIENSILNYKIYLLESELKLLEKGN